MAGCNGCREQIKTFGFHVWSFRQLLVVLLTPIVLLPLAMVFYHDENLRKPMECAYVLAIMIIYWSTQAIPIAVTALIPMLLYPLLSIVEASKLAPKYMDESNLAFIASVIVVESIDQVGLHKRLALKCLLTVGIQPRWLLLGFMFASAFIAMWLQNSVTTALMVPIVTGVTDELQLAILGAWGIERQSDPEVGHHHHADAPKRLYKNRRVSRFSFRKSMNVVASSVSDRKFKHMLLLAVAYSSSIGGVSTLIGTSPNLIMKQQVDLAFEQKECPSPLNFLSWMIYGVPISITFLALSWLVLLIRYYGFLYAIGLRKSPIDKYRDRIRTATENMYKNLPPMGIQHYVVLSHVIFMVVLMMTRILDTNPLVGWDLIAPGYAKESTAAVLVAVSLYVFPVSFPYRDPSGKWHLPKTAVTWSETAKSVPLGVILLVGGGTAAAYGAEASGLAEMMSKLIADFIKPFEDWQAMSALVIMIVYATEFMSNTACVSIMMPVLRYLAETRNTNPLFYMFPTTVAASFAFMFPVATPPNAEVFHAGTLRLIDMIGVGFFMNIIGIGIVIGATMSYGYWYFQFETPPWTVKDIVNNQTFYHCKH